MWSEAAFYVILCRCSVEMLTVTNCKISQESTRDQFLFLVNFQGVIAGVFQLILQSF